MVFADAHHMEFETPSCAIVDPSTATLLAPHKVRGQGRAHERIAFIEARNLEADIQHASISPEPNIYTSQITEIDEHGMLHGTSPQEAQPETSTISAPVLQHDIRCYVRRRKRSN